MLGGVYIPTFFYENLFIKHNFKNVHRLYQISTKHSTT